MAHTIHVLNGPNLNLLGTREPEIYGRETLADVERRCQAAADRLGLACVFRQSNHEGQLVDWIQQARTEAAGIVINPAGYSFTSIAIPDALKASDLPVIEVHITNIHRREKQYRHSFVSLAAIGVICGLCPIGYELALASLAEQLGA